jgi:hypothetical protein
MKFIKYIAITACILVFIALLVSVFTQIRNQQTTRNVKPFGTLRISKNTVLQENINTYLETRYMANGGKSFISPGDYYLCSNILYGYDDKYAYT